MFNHSLITRKVKKIHVVFLMLTIFSFSKVYANEISEITIVEDPVVVTVPIGEDPNIVEEQPAEMPATPIVDNPVVADNQTPETPALIENTTNEQATTLVHPRFNDKSTNIAFYAECPTVACPNNGTTESPEFIFFAENSGHGQLPFADYWTPDASFHKIIAVEYSNAAHQFTCSNLSLKDCIASAHFISQSSVNSNYETSNF